MATPGPFPRSPSPRTLATRKKRQAPRADRAGGGMGNARLTSTIASILLVLLAFEGITVLHVGSLLTLHVFLGLVLIPPIALKIASTIPDIGYPFFTKEALLD